MPILDQINQYKTGSIGVTTVKSTVLNVAPATSGSLPNKLTDTISQLTSKTNEISSFLNDASINGGNGPFSLSKFAREFVTKQNTSDEGQTSQVTDSKPITRKSKQITQKVVNGISNNLIKSNKLLLILETQINKVLAQSQVNYVKVENGQIVAQPIQNQEITRAVENIQQTLNTYVLAVDKYGKRIYNTTPIVSTKDLQQNFSLNHLIDFLETIISIALLLLQIKIKIRKAQDAAAAANALLTAPPQPLVAARFTQMALENTASEQKQLDDLASTQELITAVKKKIDFYGKKYEAAKGNLLNLQQTINQFQSQVTNKALQGINNQLTGSYNNLTGSLETKLNKTTGSL